MNSNKVHSRRTMPTFSWEEKPGVSKKVLSERNTTEEYSYFSGTGSGSGTDDDDDDDHRHRRSGGGGTGDDNKSQASFRVINYKLPPPPGPPEKYRASFHDGLQIPPPPCAFFQPPLRCSSRKKNDDPFLIAYKECTKSTRKDHKLDNYKVTTGCDHGGLMEFGLGLKKNISYFSCKQSCSSVVADSIIKSTSQLPVSRSRKETCRNQNS